MNRFSVFRFQSVLAVLSAIAAVGIMPFQAQAQSDVDRDSLQETAAAAVELLERDGVSASMPILEEPPFFERESGMHVWAMDGDSIVVLDASGQTSPGDDLSTLSFDNENSVSTQIREAISAGEFIVWPDLIPHAVTEALTTSQLWCLESADIEGLDEVALCAMAWFDEE